MVIAPAAFEAIVAIVAAQRVVTVAGSHVVLWGQPEAVSGSSVEQGVLGSVVADGAVWLLEQQDGFVVASVGVVHQWVQRSARVDDVEVEDVGGYREHIGGQHVGVGVPFDELGERVALQRRQQVGARQAMQVVEPVTVLEVLHLELEHKVEGRTEEASEDLGALGQAAHPQVDVVEPGDGHSARSVGPGADAPHELHRVGGTVEVARLVQDDVRGLASRGHGARPRAVVVARDERVPAVGGHEVHDRVRVA